MLIRWLVAYYRDRQKSKKLFRTETPTENLSDAPEMTKHWEPPPHGWLNVNVDDFFVDDNNNGATGMVICDELGETTALKKLKPWPFSMECTLQKRGQQNLLFLNQIVPQSLKLYIRMQHTIVHEVYIARSPKLYAW